ncbi:DegQ family serine endoprotease [Ideonella sp. BN130291]|uniref:DegQ family serine endoprotease n=1 Tax=Ideonella sp. BN130291 TaxID=3112940 RepID=UPI002E26F9FF|nr:DegQ family serine endoprotease [Ideonella sp. BN130291]
MRVDVVSPAARWRGHVVALGLCLLSAVPGLIPASAAAQPQVALPDFTELVERVGPAVVNIRTLERARQARGGMPEMDDNLEEFFRRFGIPLPGRPDQRRAPPGGGGEDESPVQRGVGSGFILSADGFVMTNAHVVEGADEVIVTLTDKRELKAKIIGADKRTDVAVVKIDAANLPFVRIGDVNKLKVGEWVLAIGSPFNLDNTVTAGIVSAKQRDTGDYLPFIQTDVAVNPGNSGGPLINMRGEVVGINSQIYSRSGGFMGISFAIPIDEAKSIADQLRANGRVIRGRIGVQITPVTKDVAESIGLGKPTGALVRSVEAGGPAEKAGIEAGDIITKVDGRSVEKSNDVQRMIGNTKPGSRVALQLFRRGNYRDVAVTVGEFESDTPRTPAAGQPDAQPAPVKALGLGVADLTEAQKRELKVRGGVRVEAAEGAAARAGLREGDVILSVDNTEIADVKQFQAVVQKADKNKPLSVLVRRGEWVNYLVIRPSR